jgi:DNA polymerase-3 subunit epsilon
MGPNSLDALCRRYGIDNSHRTRHGALLDSELLAEVYIELIGGKQAALGLEVAVTATRQESAGRETVVAVTSRSAPLPPRLTQDDLAAHALLVAELGDNAIWSKIAE